MKKMPGQESEPETQRRAALQGTSPSYWANCAACDRPGPLRNRSGQRGVVASMSLSGTVVRWVGIPVASAVLISCDLGASGSAMPSDRLSPSVVASPSEPSRVEGRGEQPVLIGEPIDLADARGSDRVRRLRGRLHDERRRDGVANDRRAARCRVRRRVVARWPAGRLPRLSAWHQRGRRDLHRRRRRERRAEPDRTSRERLGSRLVARWLVDRLQLGPGRRARGATSWARWRRTCAGSRRRMVRVSVVLAGRHAIVFERPAGGDYDIFTSTSRPATTSS